MIKIILKLTFINSIFHKQFSIAIFLIIKIMSIIFNINKIRRINHNTLSISLIINKITSINTSIFPFKSSLIKKHNLPFYQQSIHHHKKIHLQIWKFLYHVLNHLNIILYKNFYHSKHLYLCHVINLLSNLLYKHHLFFKIFHSLQFIYFWTFLRNIRLQKILIFLYKN